ncbi:hypothetical protein [Mycolicibacterium brisbanense]
MSFIRVLYAAEFKGEDVVLLAMDAAGVPIVHSALSEAVRRGSSELRHDGVIHEFRLQTGAADIRLGTQHVLWLLDCALAVTITEYLAAHGETNKPGHHYVDIDTPAETLVLSYDEYSREFLERVSGTAPPGEHSGRS